MSLRDFAVGFDADDTLWHNENIFEKVHVRYRTLLAKYHDAETVDRTLFATEMRNLERYGYGVKGFTLSAIETAIHLSESKISAEEIHQLIQLGQEMLAHPVELLPDVVETLAEISAAHPVILITKGDLRDQERKLSKSGLASHFSQIEIVSEKDARTYQRILSRHGFAPERFLMVGNSLKSDIVPVLTLGGYGAYVPYVITWGAEKVDTVPEAEGRLFTLDSVRGVPAILKQLAT